MPEASNTTGGNGRLGSGAAGLRRARLALRAALEARRSEIEQAVLTRVYAIEDPSDADPAYLEGLRDSVSLALDYALEAIERGEESAPLPPPALLAQARVAARNGVGLDTVLRRYFAGYALLGEFMAEELQGGGLPENLTLVQLLRGRAALLDRLLASVSEEYEQEAANRTHSFEQRRAKRIERLLAGELLDTSGLNYDFEAHHTGLVATGRDASNALRELATVFDRLALVIRRDEMTVWAWLGGRRSLDPTDVERALESSGPKEMTLALGQPAQGLAGWRLSHRQAAAVLPIALRRGERFVRYADVALLASALHDDLLATSLGRLYLDPLKSERNGGETAHETLRAYFAADRNATSAAALLGVNRHTVTSRLRAIEEKLGCNIASRAADLETALRLGDLITPPGRGSDSSQQAALFGQGGRSRPRQTAEMDGRAHLPVRED